MHSCSNTFRYTHTVSASENYSNRNNPQNLFNHASSGRYNYVFLPFTSTNDQSDISHNNNNIYYIYIYIIIQLKSSKCKHKLTGCLLQNWAVCPKYEFYGTRSIQHRIFMKLLSLFLPLLHVWGLMQSLDVICATFYIVIYTNLHIKCLL